MTDKIKDTIALLFMLALFLVAVLTCSSCSSVKYIDRVEKEYISRTDSFIQRDSIYHHDSVFVEHKGDTVFFNKYTILYKEKNRDIIKIDTVIRQDSIPYPVEVVREVNNKREPLYITIIVSFFIIIVYLVVSRFKKFVS